MGQTAITVVRKRVRRALDALVASQIDPDDACSFFYIRPSDCEEIEISQEDFFREETAPGTYRFILYADANKTQIEMQTEGVKIALHLDSLGAVQATPNAIPDLHRMTSSLLSSSASEVERVSRRLRDAEADCDRLKQDKCSLDDALQRARREIINLEADLEEARSQDDFSELASVLGEIAIRVYGLDPEEARSTTVPEAWEQVLVAIRKSKDAQRALSAAGAGPALLALGLGDEPGSAGATP